jgi:hypothetical protein
MLTDKKTLNHIISAFLFLAIIIAITGGTTLNIYKIKINLLSTSVWFSLTTLTILIYLRSNNDLPIVIIKIKSLLDKFQRIPHINFTVFITLVTCLTLTHYFKHIGLETHGFDMTFVQNSIANFYTNSKLLHCSICLNNSYLGEHISYSLLLLVPFEIFFKSDFVLFFVQSFLLLFPVYYLSKNYLIKYNLFWPLIAALGIQSFRSNFTWDFREDIIAYFAIIFFLISLNKNHKTKSFLFLAIALLSKEQISILIISFIPVYFFDSTFPGSKKNKMIISVILFSISLAYAYFTFSTLIPGYTLGSEKASPLAYRFGEYGNTSKEIIVNIISTPKTWFELILRTFSKGSLKYIFSFLPFFYTLYKKPIWALPILPTIFFNLIGLPEQRMQIFHYDLTIYCFLFFLIAITYRNISSRRILVLTFFAAFCLSGKWPLANINIPNLRDFTNYKFIQSITKDSIATTAKLSAQFVRKKEIYIINDEVFYNTSISSSNVQIIDRLNRSHQKNKLKPVNSKYLFLNKTKGLGLWFYVNEPKNIIKESLKSDFILVKNFSKLNL